MRRKLLSICTVFAWLWAGCSGESSETSATGAAGGAGRPAYLPICAAACANLASCLGGDDVDLPDPDFGDMRFSRSACEFACQKEFQGTGYLDSAEIAPAYFTFNAEGKECTTPSLYGLGWSKWNSDPLVDNPTLLDACASKWVKACGGAADPKAARSPCFNYWYRRNLETRKKLDACLATTVCDQMECLAPALPAGQPWIGIVPK